MVIYIRILMDNADDLNVGRLNNVEHHMPTLRKTPVVWHYIISLSTELGISCQIIETSEEDINVTLCLLDTPLFNRVIPDLLKIIPGKSTQVVSGH